MRAMGELLLANTNFKTFADFATAYLGPWAGFSLVGPTGVTGLLLRLPM